MEQVFARANESNKPRQDQCRCMENSTVCSNERFMAVGASVPFTLGLYTW